MPAHAVAMKTDPPTGHPKNRRPLPRNARIVLETLQQAQQPLKAYTLLDNLRETGINAPMTVYRALDRLVNDGVVRKISCLNAFVAVRSDPNESCAYLICRQCGHLREEVLDLATRVALSKLGVSGTHSYIEAYSDCQNHSKDS